MATTIDDRARLPNLVVIGAAKAGTTSLHYYLGLHPQIFMSRAKELRFFTDDHRHDVAWYREQFRAGRDRPVRGETSPQYTSFPRYRGVPARMHALLPDAKLIYVVRDPFARLYSHFVFTTPDDRVADLDGALEPLETNQYVAESRQCWQLEQYLPYYPLARILVVGAEELRHSRAATLARIFAFLDVDASFRSREFEAELNTTEVARRHRGALARIVHAAAGLRPARFVPPSIGLPVRNAALRLFSRPVARPRMDPAREARLRELFADDARRLRRLTGLRLAEWSV